MRLESKFTVSEWSEASKIELEGLLPARHHKIFSQELYLYQRASSFSPQAKLFKNTQ